MMKSGCTYQLTVLSPWMEIKWRHPRLIFASQWCRDFHSTSIFNAKYISSQYICLNMCQINSCEDLEDLDYTSTDLFLLLQVTIRWYFNWNEPNNTKWNDILFNEVFENRLAFMAFRPVPLYTSTQTRWFDNLVSCSTARYDLASQGGHDWFTLRCITP